MTREKNKPTTRPYPLLLYFVMVVYAVILLVLVFGKGGGTRSLNIIPFHTIAGYLHFNPFLAVSNLVGNVVLFLPMGLYFALLDTSARKWRCLLWAALVSVGIELSQYIFALGTTDVDDVILNVLGASLGILCYGLLKRWLKVKTAHTVTVLSLAFAGLFLVVAICLWTGVFGIYLRLF